MALKRLLCPHSIRALVVLAAVASALGAYKARPWPVRAADSYKAKLTSEGVTIAIEPLFTDELAGQAFDKDDMVSRGIMPIAVVVFNDNDFPVAVEGSSIELISGEDHVRSLMPNEVIARIFTAKSSKNIWLPQPPRLPIPSKGSLNAAALDDIDQKFLARKVVAGHDKGLGFLYLHLPESKDPRGYLARSRVYIPDIRRYDTGGNMIYFEVELEPAVHAGS
jgi:hypothetical protein